MTDFMDKFFISIGLDEAEIRKSDIRGVLYVGMIYLLGFTSAVLFMGMLT